MKNFNTVEERKAFESGAAYLKQYIAFCISNYVYEFTLGGVSHFIHDLCNFIRGLNYIPNTHNNISFKKFCEQYSIDE